MNKGHITRCLLTAAIIPIAAALLWTSWPASSPLMSLPHPLAIVPGGRGQLTSTDASVHLQNEARIARSELIAAIPPQGGPDARDVRPKIIGAATIAQVADGGVKLSGTGEAFYKAGFVDGDLLISVDDRNMALDSEVVNAASLLVPGAIVEIVRDGQTVEWRIGGSPQ